MNNNSRTRSALIIGGGTMGTAAAWAFARRGIDAMVFEQFDHFHTFGSHGGQTRIFRHAYSEGAEYVPLMLQADDYWLQLQDEIGLPVVHRIGILEMDGPHGNHAKTARMAGEAYGISYEWLDAAEISRRWPAFQPPEDWQGGFSDRAGFLEVEPALTGMRLMAERGGVQFHTNEPVVSWEANDSGVTVTTASDTYSGDRLVIAGGAWNGALLQSLGIPLNVVRKTLFWIDVDDPGLFQPERFPVFAASDGTTEIYGFPLFGKPGLKLADHHGGHSTTPDTVDRVIGPDESATVFEGAHRVLPDLVNRVVSSTVCLYTRTPDEHFVIDRHPVHEAVVFATGFSGHGFKFAPAIGEHLASLALEGAEPYPLFKLDRFAEVLS